MLAAPTTPDDARLVELCAASRGFVYAVGLLGVTGNRAELAATATVIAGALQGRHGQAGADRRRRVQPGTGRRGVCRSPTASSSGRRWCGAMMDGGPAAVGQLVTEYRAALDA